MKIKRDGSGDKSHRPYHPSARTKDQTSIHKKKRKKKKQKKCVKRERDLKREFEIISVHSANFCQQLGPMII